jgi:hypothetical protein
MHPAVIARYGSAQRDQCASKLIDHTEQLNLLGVSGPTAFDYRSGGQSESVSDVYVFRVDGTAGGHTGPRDYHFGLVDGRFRLFADCGPANVTSRKPA